MQKEEIHILIVDDDPTLGKGMAEVLKRAGFKSSHVLKPDDAIALMKIQAVQIAVIDCMLPKMNGRDLAKKLREEAGHDLTIIMISGVYKDKAFLRDAISTTGAVNFLTKPFDLADFQKEIEKAIKPLLDAPMAKLQQFLAQSDLAPKERIRAVDEAETVHAFDLPWIFSLLLHPKISGHLNIISADGDVSGVGFSDGKIVQVFQEDQKSYFGVLMVEGGFISQEELDEVINAPEGGKKLGQRLIDANLLSPHAVDIVMAEQQGIRLSKTVNDTSVRVNFIDATDMKVNAQTDRAALTDLTNEWMVSKFTLDWLKSFYTPWMRFSIKKGPEWANQHRVFSTATVKKVPDIARVLLEADSLEQTHAKFATSEDAFFRALHSLIISRVLRFGEAAAKTDFEAQRGRLQKLEKTLETQNHFERLGVSPKAKDSEVRRAYHDLAKVLHPDKIAADAPADVRDLAKRTFEKIATAYATLSDPKAKEKYVLELDKGRAEAQLQAESLSEQARPLLSKGDVKKAKALLEEAVDLAPPTSETRLLLCWAKLKGPGSERDSKLINSIKEELGAIPPEDRHSAYYFFVRGLLMRASGDMESARRNFDHVIAQAPDFIDARRELNSLLQTSGQSQKTNILNTDLRDVVGMLFKKKR